MNLHGLLVTVTTNEFILEDCMIKANTMKTQKWTQNKAKHGKVTHHRWEAM